MAKQFSDFTNLFSLHKTIRFAANRTASTSLPLEILEKDTTLAKNYQEAKLIIDRYHKMFINKVLSNQEILPYSDNGKKESLSEYFKYYFEKGNANDTDAKENFKKTQDSLRTKISDSLKKEGFERLFKKELITEILPKFVTEEKEREIISDFSKFTSYFTGFHENRKNIYTDEEKSTAIAYRLINENLPKFIDNMQAFLKIKAVPESENWFKALSCRFSKEINVDSISQMFELSYYNHLLTQNGIDAYNTVIGGTTSEDCKQNTPGLNQYINLYNQTHKDQKLPKFKMLFKQILSDRESLSWLPEKFESDNQLLTAIKKCYEDLSQNVLGNNALKTLLCSLAEYDLSGIFINKKNITEISNRLFGSWYIIPDAIKEQIKREQKAEGKNETDEEYIKRIEKVYDAADSFSVQHINDCLSKEIADKKYEVQNYFSGLGKKTGTDDNLFDVISKCYDEASPLINSTYPSKKKLSADDENIDKIKTLLDAIKDLQHFIKPLLGHGDESDKDERFAYEFSTLWEELDAITPLYTKVQSYITSKPYSQDKIKLNFGNYQLLNGWDKNKEKDCASIILRRNGLYYLAIMNNSSKNLFSTELPTDGDCYEKMIYKLLPGPNKMLPKVFFSKKRISEFCPSNELLNKYRLGTYKKGKNFNLSDCHNLIDFFKASIAKHEDWKNFGFKFSETSTYEDIQGFYNEIEQQGYMISFTKVSVSYIEQAVKAGKLHFFQIYNKDFSQFSKGIQNIHTMYWKALFDPNNNTFKLNGESEIFFRKKSLPYFYPTHPANVPIINKNPQNKTKESVFKYDLIKDRRYTIDKCLFHTPITINYKCKGSNNINPMVNEYLHDADDIHIIGIDRGERNLIYICIIDLNGNIIDQISLNEIINVHNGLEHRTDYHKLLDKRENENQDNRKNWKTIEGIKDLKEGYLSQVIHKIAQLMVKYHAIVVLEDLSLKGFMRMRQKVEKSVYQQFEHKLIDKLNYLVDKQTDANMPGGVLNGYQLTNKFESFEKIGKQSGFLFYVPAWNTSKIDPVTGFVNLFSTRYKNIIETKKIFKKFQSIRYNAEKDWFEFSFDYSKILEKELESRTKWTICTYGERIRVSRKKDMNNIFEYERISLTEKFKEFFEKRGIDIHSDLREAILQHPETERKKAIDKQPAGMNFFEELLSLFRLTLQMRNSDPNTGDDYIISPAIGTDGKCFDSRLCDDSLPKDADANGAYNIARKGLMIVNQIKAAEDLSKIKFNLSNVEWLKFAQKNTDNNE